LLQAACFAGTVRAPLFVTHGTRQELDVLRDRLAEWRTEQVYLVGDAHKLGRALPKVRHVRLADEAAVVAAHRRRLGRRVETLVVANPADTGEGMGVMSALAPWVALQKRAALLLTNKDGKNVAEVVQKATRDERLRHADALVLVANLQAIPMLQRPNPIPTDKDPQIEMEPLTPSGAHPFSFATGRLFHEELGTVPLLLARQRLLAGGAGPRRALVASNPGGGLSLLETLSRNTAQELRNAGYETTALFGHAVKPAELRRLMTQSDLFLWEGHHNTLIRDWAFPDWNEPMPPAFVFLQSCLALQEPKVQRLLSRGAVGVVGTSTRTYSGSGGACSLAFFNALLYDDQSLGGSLRQAKNFLLAYSLLKEKRLGKGATRTGANLRAAWAFTLWGDPTLRLPQPEAAGAGLPAIRHEVTGHTIVLALPEEMHSKVTTDKYQARMAPNGRLAGLVRKSKDEGGHPLVPFVFAEVHLPKGRPGQVPRLTSRLPATHWVFCWDERRRVGYLLATPRARDPQELRFRVQWQSTETAESAPAAVGP
jgi:peptidase C25-like protein